MAIVHDFRKVALVAVALAGALLTAVPAGAQTVPADVAADVPADAEYASIFFCKELEKDLGLSADQIAKLDNLKARLQFGIDNASARGNQVTAYAMTRIAQSALALNGKDAKAVLTAEQDKQFMTFFKDGTVKPLVLRGADASAGRSPVNSAAAARVDIVYHYKDVTGSYRGETVRVNTPTGTIVGHNDSPVTASPAGGGASAGGGTGSAAQPPVTAAGGNAGRGRVSPPARGRGGQPEASTAVNSLEEAEHILADASAPHAPAAQWLAKAEVDPKEQAKVLDLLRPSLLVLNQVNDAGDWAVYVEAFAHWSNSAAAPELLAVLQTHKSGLPNNFDKCWSAAILGLMHADMKSAEKVLTERKGELFFRNAVVGALKPLAQGDGPDKALAEHLLVLLLL